MKRSKKYSINWRDAFHGLIMAFGGAFLDAVINIGTVMLKDEKALDPMAVAKEAAFFGALAAATYVFKKYFQNSDSKFTPEPKNTLQ